MYMETETQGILIDGQTPNEDPGKKTKTRKQALQAMCKKNTHSTYL